MSRSQASEDTHKQTPRRQVRSPTTCGSVEASRSSMMVPFSMHFFSSIKLCKDSVATWGLLQRSPPFSTFSSNLIHLGGGDGKRHAGVSQTHSLTLSDCHHRFFLGPNKTTRWVRVSLHNTTSTVFGVGHSSPRQNGGGGTA